jgi:zinc transporter 1
MLGALFHVLGDALNNLGVIGAGLAMWLGSPHDHRYFFADPAASVIIAVMVMLSAWPLLKKSGEILMQSAPSGVRLEDVRHDLEMVST